MIIYSQVRYAVMSLVSSYCTKQCRIPTHFLYSKISIFSYNSSIYIFFLSCRFTLNDFVTWRAMFVVELRVADNYVNLLTIFEVK
jgi:hypothetical protein